MAAQVVLMAHLAEWFYLPFHEYTQTAWLQSAGSLAVAMFFVLSGALISNSISRQLETSKFNILTYAKARIIRIYPTLLAALVITGICYALISTFGLQGYPAYDKETFAGELARDSAQIKASTMVASGLFLNGMIGISGWNVGTVSMNGPLWSLAHEFWFYAMAGLYGAYVHTRNRWAFFFLGAFVLFQVIVGNWKWLVGLCVWLTGTTVFSTKQKVPKYTPALLFMIIGAAYFVGVLYPGKLLTFGVQGLLSAGFLFCMLSFVRATKSKSKAATHMAAYSYTLYAIHWPLLQLAFGAAGKWLLTVTWSTHLLFSVVLVLVINFLSWNIARFTENAELWKSLSGKLSPNQT